MFATHISSGPDLAHDLNNLLQTIQGFAEMAQGEQESPDRQGEHLVCLLRAVDRARCLVDTFQAPPAAPAAACLTAVLDDAACLLQPFLPRHAEVRVQVDGQNLEAAGHDVSLLRVVFNLGTNATQSSCSLITFSAAIAEIDQEYDVGVGLGPVGPTIRIRVEDNGSGMDQETMDCMFEPRFTSEVHRASEGLGLSIVRNIVLELRGAIRVASRPGHGTRVDVFLPAPTDHRRKITDRRGG